MAAPNLGERNPNFGRNDARRDQLLGELILYIASKCAGDDLFGAVKLNKILWMSDFLAFAEHGEPITGVQYQRLVHGPAPRRLVPVRDVLVEKADAIVQRRHMLGGQIQERVVHLREPNLDLFSAAQIDLVDRVINDLREKSASEVSLDSHGKAWQTARHGEGIPYEAVFLSDEPVNNLDIERTKELAAQYGW